MRQKSSATSATHWRLVPATEIAQAATLPPLVFFFLLSEIISYMYLGFRAETRVNGALYALQRAFQVPATSATGRRLPVPANKIAHIAAHTTVFFLFLNLRR